MSDRVSHWVESIIVGLTFALLVLVFVPWVKTGVLQESDTINGIDIPVIGWSTIVMGVITLTLAIVAFLRQGSWWWCGYVFSLGLMITGATVVLTTLDVMDSSVVGWITKALPDDLEQASPQLQATFTLWFAYSIALIALVAGSFTAVVRMLESEDDDEDTSWDPIPKWESTPIPADSPWGNGDVPSERSPWGDQGDPPPNSPWM